MYIIKLTKYVKGFELKISKCLTTILFMLPKIQIINPRSFILLGKVAQTSDLWEEKYDNKEDGQINHYFWLVNYQYRHVNRTVI